MINEFPSSPKHSGLNFKVKTFDQLSQGFYN